MITTRQIAAFRKWTESYPNHCLREGSNMRLAKVRRRYHLGRFDGVQDALTMLATFAAKKGQQR